MALLDIVAPDFTDSNLSIDLVDGDIGDIVSIEDAIMNIPAVVGGGGSDFEYVYGFFS